MLTLKFIKSYFGKNQDGQPANLFSTQKVMICRSYEVVEYENRTEIIVHAGYTEEAGVVHTLISESELNKIGPDSPAAPYKSWTECFVENFEGKTIDRIKAPFIPAKN